MMKGRAEIAIGQLRLSSQDWMKIGNWLRALEMGDESAVEKTSEFFRERGQKAEVFMEIECTENKST